MTSTGRIVWSLALLCLSACGANLREIAAASDDYADYRAFRVAPTVAGRLKAASFYLSCHGDGAFRDEVRQWFDRVEPLYFEASADSSSGMSAYLEALPSGPHAESAAQRRDALRAAARVEAGERLSAAGAAIEQRLAAAAQSREDVLTTYASWLGRLIDFDAWGRPIDDAAADFASSWAGDPKPKCSSDRCSKLFSLRYQLEVRGRPETFVCLLEVSLRLSGGRVAEAAVSGPELFSRLAEAHEAEPVSESLEARVHAIKYAVELTSGAIERRLARARCGKDAPPPAVMVRECDGYKLELVPKTTSSEEDRVVIRRATKL